MIEETSIRQDYAMSHSLVNAYSHYSMANTKRMGLKENLQALLKASGENPHSLAAKLRQRGAGGPSQPTLSRILDGTSKDPRRESLKPVARFFGVSVDELYSTLPDNRAHSSGSRANNEDFSIDVLDVAASMGTGELRADTENVIHRLSIGIDWVRDNLRGISSTANLRVISGRGTSMEPTYSDGAILVVDTGDRAARDNQVYVMSAGDRIFVKRVHQRVDGRFDITSDNPTAKGVETLNGDHEVTIHGRVVWAWDGKRL